MSKRLEHCSSGLMFQLLPRRPLANLCCLSASPGARERHIRGPLGFPSPPKAGLFCYMNRWGDPMEECELPVYLGLTLHGPRIQ